MTESSTPTSSSPFPEKKKIKLWQRLLPWLITIVCFAYLYNALHHAAASQGSAVVPYLAKAFENVNWLQWLALMVPYCILFLLIDSLSVFAAINWFNTKIGYLDILPIRASAYILSLVNEQLSKGAIAYYVNRRDGIPGWEVGSSMIFLMFCEYYSLIAWATLGVVLQWSHVPEVFHAIPWVALGSLVFFAFFHLFFSGKIGARIALRDRPIFRAFRMAKVWQYAAVLVMRAPLMIAGVIAYTLALRLFGGTVSYGEMLGFLPVIFFGAATPGPMHSVAILFWVLLFPDKPAQMTAFGLVQHNFFIVFNAVVGLLFLRRATKALN